MREWIKDGLSSFVHLVVYFLYIELVHVLTYIFCSTTAKIFLRIKDFCHSLSMSSHRARKRWAKGERSFFSHLDVDPLDSLKRADVVDGADDGTTSSQGAVQSAVQGAVQGAETAKLRRRKRLRLRSRRVAGE